MVFASLLMSRILFIFVTSTTVRCSATTQRVVEWWDPFDPDRRRVALGVLHDADDVVDTVHHSTELAWYVMDPIRFCSFTRPVVVPFSRSDLTF